VNEKLVTTKQQTPHFSSQIFAMKRRDRINDRVPAVSEVVIGKQDSLCSDQTARMKSVK
jgi:hypothetical protein